MIYYFFGDNSYEAVEQIKKLKAEYQKKTSSMLDIEQFDMGESNLADLLNSFSVVAMFATVRMVIAYDLYLNKTAKDDIDNVITLVPDSTILVIYDRGVDRRGSYFKKLAKLKHAKEFTPLNPVNMRNWINIQVKKNGGNIDGLSVQKLYELVAHEYKYNDKEQMKLCGQDQWQLEQEIIKLVNYEPHITIETINELVVPNIEQTIFALTDAVARAKSKEAIGIYEQLHKSGVSDQQILAMLNWQFRNIVLAKENLGSGPDWSAQFGISQFVASKALQLGDSVDFELIKRAYGLMFEADLSIKTGDKDSQLALEELIYQLCAS